MQTAIACLHAPSPDTLQTLSALPLPARAACNLSKDPTGGLTGLVTDTPADTPLFHLHNVTAELFSGVSLVACHGELPSDLADALAGFADEYSRAVEGPTPSLADLTPLGRQNDFFFLEQEMHVSGNHRLLDVVRQNGERGLHEFLELYEMRPAKHGSFQVFSWLILVREISVMLYSETGMRVAETGPPAARRRRVVPPA